MSATTKQDLTEAIEAILEVYRADMQATPDKEALENLREAYGAIEDGTEAYQTLRSHLKEAADNVDPADTLAFASVAVADRAIREAVDGVRGKGAKEARATIGDVSDPRAAEVAEQLIALGTVENAGSFASGLATAVEEFVATWDEDYPDGDPKWTKATQRGVAAITDDPKGGSGGGPSHDRDLSAITGTEVEVFVEHDGAKVTAKVTTPTGERGDITVTDENGQTYGSLSAFGGEVTGYSTNGWKKVYRATDGTPMGEVCPKV